jgi:hypothetical protein
MTLDEKIERSCGVVSSMLKRYKNPCVLWSSGKDSMVLLHLLKFKMGLDFPVVCWREPWMPWKLEFTNRIIQEWKLEAWDWAPSAVKLCRGMGRIDVMTYYQINSSLISEPQHMIVARGTEPPEEGLPFLCGLETFLAKPLGTFNFPWDGMFIGHKSDDEDPLSGKVPLEVDWLQIERAAAGIYPIRDWTDVEVYEYIERFDVPFDETRYDVKNRTTVKNNKLNNPDYYHTCFKCCDPRNSAFVHCPKYDVDVNNISHLVPWVDPKMPYCNMRNDIPNEPGV